MNIISFNVGIELGQISALAVMLLLISAFRKSHAFKSFTKAANSFLIIAGGYLFLMQMHGYEHVVNADELVAKAESNPVSFKSESSGQSNWKDTISITIPARGDTEYKLFLAKGAAFEYSWKSNGEKLFYDFHGEPAGDTTGYFKSFNKSTESEASGTLIAVFDGTHGWYWKNNTSSAVDIILKINGEYQRIDIKKKQQINSMQQNSTKQHDTIF